MSEEDAADRLVDFFDDEAARQVPYVAISSALWAEMAMRAARGKKEPPNRGTFADVKAVATGLPICDAMFLDNELVGIFQNIPREFQPRGGERLYSSKRKDEFLEYLRSLKVALRPAHLLIVERVYGCGWHHPNRAPFAKSA